MKSFLKRTVITGVAVILAVRVVPGIEARTPEALILASLLLAVLNAVVRPVMVILALPLLIFTLGLFILVINALLLRFVGNLVPNFTVETFAAAFWGSLIISIVSLVLNSLTNSGNARVQFHKGKPPPRPSGDDGPVIDV